VRRRILCETGHENGGQKKPRTQTREHVETFGRAFRETSMDHLPRGSLYDRASLAEERRRWKVGRQS
jgi:hypothetical protein